MAPVSGYMLGVSTRQKKLVSWKHCPNILNSCLQIDQNIKACSSQATSRNLLTLSCDRSKAFPYILIIGAQRSDDVPIHRVEGGHYEKGQDALVNALLLSRCSTLIRTTSSCPRSSILNLN